MGTKKVLDGSRNVPRLASCSGKQEQQVSAPNDAGATGTPAEQATGPEPAAQPGRSASASEGESPASPPASPSVRQGNDAGIGLPPPEGARSRHEVTGPTGPPQRPDSPLLLQGVYDGPVRNHAPAGAGFRFEIPVEWNIDDREAGMMYINPGVAADSRDQAPIFFTSGELIGQDRRRSVTELVDKQEPHLVRVFAQLGVNLFSGTNEVPAAPVALGEFAGAVRTWNAELPDGRPAQIWFGATARYDRYYSVFGVTPVAAVDQVQAGMRRILSSLRVASPARNMPLEGLLEGRQLTAPGTSPAVIHWFTAGNAVRRQTFRASDGAVFEEHGRFEVIDDEVWLFFPTGQNVGRMVSEDGAFAGVHFGTNVHRIEP